MIQMQLEGVATRVAPAILPPLGSFWDTIALITLALTIVSILIHAHYKIHMLKHNIPPMYLFKIKEIFKNGN
jgi:hypothetical protein